jgi:hypothetical protein
MTATATAAAAVILGAAIVVGPPPREVGRVLLDPPVAAAPETPGLQGKTRPTSAPELPKAAVDTREPVGTGRTIHVPAGDSLQAALDNAQPGDRITLEAGATYEGPLKLRRKNGDAWIVIASNRLRELPAGKRVNPSHARLMPKLVASSRSAIITDPGAHHYRFAGIEVAPAAGEFLHNLIELGGDDANLTEVPHHIVFDRAYIHGDPRKGGRRGVAFNGRELAVINSYLSDFKEAGADSQAISGWNGPGPFKIENNYLEGAGENVMFGGADPAINGLVPSDIEIVRNHFAKPLRWKIDDPSYEGTPWTVKNLFELKNARRVLVEGNLLEHNWPHAQNGFAILFTPRNVASRFTTTCSLTSAASGAATAACFSCSTGRPACLSPTTPPSAQRVGSCLAAITIRIPALSFRTTSCRTTAPALSDRVQGLAEARSIATSLAPSSKETCFSAESPSSTRSTICLHATLGTCAALEQTWAR